MEDSAYDMSIPEEARIEVLAKVDMKIQALPEFKHNHV